VTMGVRLMNLAPGDTVVALARNAESAEDSEAVEDEINEMGDEGNDLGDNSV